MMKTKWSSLALLSALTLAGVASDVGRASAEPVRSHGAGRIAQQRSGALDRRAPERGAETKRLDQNEQKRAELQRMQQQQQQRAGRAEKRR